LKTNKENSKDLGWRDYVSLIIAMLTTTLLPILIIILILIIAVIILVFTRKPVSVT